MSTGLPERGQLLHLLDRAERRVLTPAEAALLRASVVQLLDAPAAVQDQRAADQAEIDELRAELAQAQRQAAEDRARVERVLADAGSVSPLLVACPSCGALAGSRCRAVRGSRRVPYVEHAPRRRAVGRVLFAEALAEAGAA